MPRIGLNAQLLSTGQSYRGAGVSHYIDRLLAYLPEVDSAWDGVAFVGPDVPAPPGWTTRRAPWSTASPWSRILWEQTLQPWEVRRLKLDLLHATVYVGPVLGGCAQVVSVHDLTFFLYPETLRPPNRIYLQKMSQVTMAQSQAIITGSQSTADDLTRVLGVAPGRITVIPDGVDEAMRPIADQVALSSLRLRYGLPKSFVLFLGTLEPRKNLPLLLEAWAMLKGRGQLPHKLVIAGGKGWYFAQVDQAVARLGLEDDVIFPGFVPQDELPLWYSAAELFVYPSLYEGFGLPPLEAMACGTPVVVSDVSSLPEVVGEAGVRVPPDDPQALAEALAALLGDASARQALSEAGLVQARRFSWRETARRTRQLYARVLGEIDGFAE